MSVTVKFSGQARDVAGVPSLTSVAARVDELLRELARANEALRPLLLRPDGSPSPSLLIVVGDEQVRVDDPRPLRAGEVVTVMTPIAGG